MEWSRQYADSPWIQLPLEVWSPLIRGRTPQRYPKNAFVFREGDPAHALYIVCTGRLRVSSFHPDGSEKQVYILEHGATGGEQECLMGEPYYADGVAIVDSDVYAIPVLELRATMAADPALLELILSMLCRKNRILYNQVMELSFLQSPQRVAHLLLALCHQYGVPCAEGTRISIRFTQQDVGNMVNLSRVTVNSVFNQLTESGVLKRSGGRTIVCDMQALQRIIAGAEGGFPR